jgi:hypothetical protein
MIQLTTIETLGNAINKARTVKPLVRVIMFGKYAVTNKATLATYTVTCEKRDGKRLASCDCKAGARGTACYHVAAAVSAHLQLAQERAALNF